MTANAFTVATFWSATLGRPLDRGASEFFATIGFAGRRDEIGWAPAEKPTFAFGKVPEPKTAKNRMHLDVIAPDPDAEIERLGATIVRSMREYGYTWTVMHDPEGNEFCVAKALESDVATEREGAGDP